MNSIPIFLSSDNNYSPFVATTMASICSNTKSFCDFYILDGGISEENKKKIKMLEEKFKNLKIEYINLKKNIYTSLSYKNDVTHVTQATYNRLLIPEIKKDIDKAIYLDVDVIVLKDIKQFYMQDLENKMIGVIVDIVPPEHIMQVKQDIGMDRNSQYFNAGVLLLDCKKCREQNAVNEMFKIAIEKQDVLHMADQDILNIFFENNKKLLDSSFNVLYDNEDAFIRHFIGEIKPWDINYRTECKYISNLKDFWTYAKMTPYYFELNSKTENQDLQSNLYRKLRFMSMVKTIKKIKK